jgi:pimeloyl-ACP methyl ester carboxylesterase
LSTPRLPFSENPATHQNPTTKWCSVPTRRPPSALYAGSHAATYALHHAVHRPGTVNRLVLIAPTWRGPLPTVMEGERRWFARARAMIDAPVIGPLLYRLNVSRFVVSRMARGHVYSDPAWLTGDRLAKKLAVTRAEGAHRSSWARRPSPAATRGAEKGRCRTKYMAGSPRGRTVMLLLAAPLRRGRRGRRTTFLSSGVMVRTYFV